MDENRCYQRRRMPAAAEERQADAKTGLGRERQQLGAPDRQLAGRLWRRDSTEQRASWTLALLAQRMHRLQRRVLVANLQRAQPCSARSLDARRRSVGNTLHPSWRLDQLCVVTMHSVILMHTLLCLNFFSQITTGIGSVENIVANGCY